MNGGNAISFFVPGIFTRRNFTRFGQKNELSRRNWLDSLFWGEISNVTFA